MITYKDINNDSWVSSYEFWEDYIEIQFKNTWKIYKYTNNSAWADNINNMKILADRWDWLQSYINKNKPWFVW